MIGKTELVVAFFVAALLAGLFLNYGSSTAMPARENFMQHEIGMPINGGGIGPYDQVNSAGVAGLMTTEPSSSSGGVAPAGQSEDPNKLMYLVGNEVSNTCCPSAFNTDTGCLCLTDDQKNFMARRGNNK
jgi:hypothetical protein